MSDPIDAELEPDYDFNWQARCLDPDVCPDDWQVWALAGTPDEYLLVESCNEAQAQLIARAARVIVTAAELAEILTD